MLLKVKEIETYYGNLQVIRKVSFGIDASSIVCFFGPNGHGKSTLLKTICGACHPASGSITFEGLEISKFPTHRVVELGVVYVPEEGHLFTNMTVIENLKLGAYTKKARDRMSENLAFVFQLFPRLEERKTQKCSTLSGGERRMVAIGRGLMTAARLLMLDEPSFGLAPKMVKAVFQATEVISKTTGISIIVVEQEIKEALKITDKAYILRKGTIVDEGDRASLNYEKIQSAYF